MKCPHCGDEHPDDAPFCPRTGEKLRVQERLCKNCGALLPAAVSFCPACGRRVAGTPFGTFIDWVRQALKGPRGRRELLIGTVFVVGVIVIALSNWNPTDPIVMPTKARTQAPSGMPPLPTSISTSTPYPRHTRTPVPGATTAKGPWEACQTDYLSRLHINDRAYVSYEPPLANRVRAQPNGSAKILGYIKPGEQLKILDGPSCANAWVWWYVRADKTGLKGWTSEGDSENYWLIPMP